LLCRIVLGPNQSAHQARPGFSASRQTFPDVLLRTVHGCDPFCFENRIWRCSDDGLL
jgi:hypothetical protein